MIGSNETRSSSQGNTSSVSKQTVLRAKRTVFMSNKIKCAQLQHLRFVNINVIYSGNYLKNILENHNFHIPAMVPSATGGHYKEVNMYMPRQ